MKYILLYRHWVARIALFVLIYEALLVGSVALSTAAANAYINWHIRPESIPYATHQTITEPTPQLVASEYLRQATRAGWTMAEINKGWNVLYCESSFKYNAKNPKSSALGVAQYITGTWNSVAPQGESRLNYRLSIALFIQNFPTHQGAWSECL